MILAGRGVVLRVDGVVHGGGGRVGFFVSVDGGGVLQEGADIVEALQQNFRFQCAGIS